MVEGVQSNSPRMAGPLGWDPALASALHLGCHVAAEQVIGALKALGCQQQVSTLLV